MITYSKEKRIFTIHTENTTYQMQADAYGVLLHLYYGARADGEMDYLIRTYDRGFSGNPFDAGRDRTYSLDVLPQEYPALGTGDYRRPALMVELENGAVSCDLRYRSHEIRPGKYALPGLPAVYDVEKGAAETLVITLEDRWGSGVVVDLLYGVLPEADIITRSVIVRNEGDAPFALTRVLSANLDLLAGAFDVITFHGRHGMERNIQRSPLGHGVTMIGSTRGMSSHHYNPLMLLAERDANEDAGLCYGMEFVYSGGFLAEAERDDFDQTRMQMGIADEQFRWTLLPGESFAAPEVILSCSTDGLAHLSQNFHDCLRRHVCRGKWRDAVRPILLNSWEGCYFQFDGERILALARESAALGFDMLVMDDGWFGGRNDDNTALGDWWVNEKKLGCTLGELTKKVNDMGLRFGIWIEPEMVSEDSELYRTHPDWTLMVPGRGPVRARNQLVLDFSRPEVVDAIYRQIAEVLDSASIDYIKWDYNRSIADVYSAAVSGGAGAAGPSIPRGQGEVLHRYILGLYDFLERLHRDYPEILLEGCSGGGGRFDAGMLYYAPQIWCSDNTDAIDRLRIQYGTSFGYPISAVGSHVSVCPNHQSGRITPLRTRGVVAMAGTFGYELDPTSLTEEEKEEVRRQIAICRAHAQLIADGKYFRLSDPERDPVAAWMFAARDASEALLCTVNLETHCNSPQRYVRLRGLDSAAIYEVQEIGKDDSGSRISLHASGAALMQAGIPIPLEMGEYGARMVSIKKC